MSGRDTGDWGRRYDQWLNYVQQTIKAFDAGNTVPVGPTEPPFEAPPAPQPAGKPANILIAAPHPDDECLISTLPLRLRRETGARVVDCAITLGKNTEQIRRRTSELRCACRVLDFILKIPLEEGFHDVTLQNREEHPREWTAKVDALREVFNREQPDVVFAPHAEDFHTAHIGTHYLVVAALRAHLEDTARGPIPLIETEFWHAHSSPNLMVGVSPEILAIQIMATAEHGGEVRRNPYHLQLPARMVDNVRRGSEVVCGQGAPAQGFPFAELYRVNFMEGAGSIPPRPGGRIIGPSQKFDLAWLLSEFWPENI